MHTKTLNPLQEQLLQYDIKINYHQGASNSAADTPSRNVSDQTDHFISSMSDDSGEQKLDPFIMDVRDFILKNETPGGSPGYTIYHGAIDKNTNYAQIPMQFKWQRWLSMTRAWFGSS